jgi:hypothetical protein
MATFQNCLRTFFCQTYRLLAVPIKAGGQLYTVLEEAMVVRTPKSCHKALLCIAFSKVQTQCIREAWYRAKFTRTM